MRRWVNFLILAVAVAWGHAGCDRERSNPVDPESSFSLGLPTAPTGVTAADGVGLISVYWVPVADPDLAGYAVYRAGDSDGEYAFLPGDGDSEAQITTGKISFTDSLDTPGETYYYRVAAIDTSGLRSPMSPFSGATVLEDWVPPGEPMAVSLELQEDRADRVVVRWSAPLLDADGGPLTGVAGYLVLRSGTAALAFVEVAEVGADQLEYADEGVAPSSTYVYTVVAFDAAGNRSGQAVAVQVVTLEGG